MEKEQTLGEFLVELFGLYFRWYFSKYDLDSVREEVESQSNNEETQDDPEETQDNSEEYNGFKVPKLILTHNGETITIEEVVIEATSESSMQMKILYYFYIGIVPIAGSMQFSVSIETDEETGVSTVVVEDVRCAQHSNIVPNTFYTLL